MMSMNPSDMAVLNIKSYDYGCIISGIRKSEAINLKQNTNLTVKSGTLEKIKDLFSYKKISKKILTFGGIEIEKNKFYRHKSPIFLKDVDIEKVLV